MTFKKNTTTKRDKKMNTKSCNKCNLPIAFKSFRKDGKKKIKPVNVDGTDHYNTCREMQSKIGRELIRQQSEGILKPIDNPNKRKPKSEHGITYPNHNDPLYSGDEPPWKNPHIICEHII